MINASYAYILMPQFNNKWCQTKVYSMCNDTGEALQIKI